MEYCRSTTLVCANYRGALIVGKPEKTSFTKMRMRGICGGSTAKGVASRRTGSIRDPQKDRGCTWVRGSAGGDAAATRASLSASAAGVVGKARSVDCDIASIAKLVPVA